MLDERLAFDRKSNFPPCYVAQLLYLNVNLLTFTFYFTELFCLKPSGVDINAAVDGYRYLKLVTVDEVQIIALKTLAYYNTLSSVPLSNSAYT